MNTFSLKSFHLNGIWLFQIERYKIFCLLNWHYWSTIITSILLIVSGVRCQYYLNINLEPNSSGYIFNFLAKSEPLVTITELMLSSTILYQRKKLENMVRTVIDLSSSETKRSAIVVIVVNLMMLVTLYKFTLNLVSSEIVRITTKLDAVACCVQITIRTCHLLFIAVTLFVINFNLEKWKKMFTEAKNDVDQSYHNLIKISELYSTFSDLFYFLMNINVVHCFYGFLLGLKRIEDALYRSADDYQEKYDGIIILLNLFHLPMILLICHAGQIFQEKVTIWVLDKV